MKVSLNWIKDYVDLTGISVNEIAAKLTMSGLEVEDVINQSEIYRNFVVGYVKEKQKHPNADKLSLCTVYDGTDELQVVCGAPNIEAGQKVIFAKVGAIVPNGEFKITKAKIRGTESFGMICSGSELLLNDDQSGIIVLPDSYEAGTPISEALLLNDVIFELGITPNRPDALSHIGVARDIAAIFELPLKYPDLNKKNIQGDIGKYVSIEINDPVNCPRYCGKLIEDVVIGESPLWLKRRLESVGLRPINNVVDVTNYVMLEFGQPLHAFDLDLLSGNKIIIDSSETESEFITLDSKKRKTPPGTLFIRDGEKPVAIGGIMGGENSEITGSTKRILIESAYFNPSSIRRTSKSLGLSSESSYRFERGTDPNNCNIAAQRAAELIVETGKGKVVAGILDVYPNRINPHQISFRYARCEKVLGYKISYDTTSKILTGLGMNIKKMDKESLLVEVPTFRPDIEREIDLIEEVARINGYDNIPEVPRISVTLEKRYDHADFDNKLKDYANSMGFSEIITNPLIAQKYAEVAGNALAVLNPQSMDMSHLRTSLLQPAMEVVSNNLNVGEKDLMLFETGRVFNRLNEKEIKDFSDFKEEGQAVFVITGRKSIKSWQSEEKHHDYYSLKGFADTLIAKFSLDSVLNDSYYDSAFDNFAYGFRKSYNNKVLVSGGKVKKDVLKLYDINQDVFAFIINTDHFKEIEPVRKMYKEPLKYPKIVRDFAFIFNKTVTYFEVEEFISKQKTEFLKSVELFDVFESDAIGEGKKSLAFTLEFYSEDKTLTEQEVEKEFSGLINKISKEFKATLRGT